MRWKRVGRRWAGRALEKLRLASSLGFIRCTKNPRGQNVSKNHPLHQPLHEMLMSFLPWEILQEKKATVVGGKLHGIF